MTSFPESQQPRNGPSNAPEKKTSVSERKPRGEREPKSQNLFMGVAYMIDWPTFRNVKLLSFGADEDATEQSEPVTFKKKAIVRPDCGFFGWSVAVLVPLDIDYDCRQWWMTLSQRWLFLILSCSPRKAAIPNPKTRLK